jgi:uncharacterized protein (DUF1015 family)
VAKVLSPPYDIIGPQMQEALYARSPYNVVRLELGKTLPEDSETDNRYTRAAVTMKQWLQEGALVRDREPAFYLMADGYRQGDARRERLSLFACLRLEEYGRGAVLPHEHTRDAPKQDRLRLTQATHADISPIMVLYRDPGALKSILQAQMERAPQMDAREEEGKTYRLWVIRDRNAVARIRVTLAQLPIYIADGHHRYETALAYRDMMRAQKGQGTGRQAYNYRLVGLTAMGDTGLQLLSFHRLLSGLGEAQMAALHRRIAELFDTQDTQAISTLSVEGLASLVGKLTARGDQEVVMGWLDGGQRTLSLLSLKVGLAPEQLPTPPVPEMLSCVPWLLHQAVLGQVLQGSGVREQGTGMATVEFTHELEDVVKGLEGGQCQGAFLLRPISFSLFEALSRLGQRLPPKSTYFYPKLPTGLVMASLEGEI